MGWGDNIARNGFDEFGRELGDAIDRAAARVGKHAKKAAKKLDWRGRPYDSDDVDDDHPADHLGVWPDRTRDEEDDHRSGGFLLWGDSHDDDRDRDDRDDRDPEDDGGFLLWR